MDQISSIYRNITMNVTRDFLLEKLRWYQLENFITLIGIKNQNNQKMFTGISNIFNRKY